jgi:uncharacterized protein (TIGR03435 family)
VNHTVHPARTLLPLFLLVTAIPAPSQKAEGNLSPRRFDVVSIKRSGPDAVIQDMRITLPPGRIEALNITLSEMLLSFSGFSGKVEGGPKWVESERYDVIAKADGEITTAERGPMLMALLEDRFKLAVHHEAREEPGIALTKGKQLPDVKPAKEGVQTLGRLDDHRQVIFRNVRMSQFASYLRGMWGYPVVDRTGMAGNYDFSLDPDSFAITPGEAFRDRIRSAVEALGFKLEPQRVTRDVTVIDHVERLTEN